MIQMYSETSGADAPAEAVSLSSGADALMERVASRPLVFVAFLILLAALCSIRRFGARENEQVQTTHSDSDLYLEMSAVFTGQSHTKGFDRKYADVHGHHYNRPALPFMAGWLGHALLGGDFRTSFSLINIAASVVIAFTLFRLIRSLSPNVDYAWTAPVLFLTAFPQVNWGYHILTDTLGFATALLSAAVAVRLLDEEGDRSRNILGFAALVLIQATAWLTRETALFPVVCVAVVAGLQFLERRLIWSRLFAIIGVMLVTRIPLMIYSNHFDVGSISKFYTQYLLQPSYIADTLVKSAVAFHICWIPVFYFAVRGVGFVKTIPPFFQAWTVAALLYIVAGYSHNRPEVIGYPLRLTFALFPLIFYLAARFLTETKLLRPRWLSATRLCGVFALISLVGALMDQGRGRLTVEDLLTSLM